MTLDHYPKRIYPFTFLLQTSDHVQGKEDHHKIQDHSEHEEIQRVLIHSREFVDIH